MARYAHTNVVARDWRRLAEFYEAVFGCVPVPPERDLDGEWLARGTGIEGAALKGVHLRFPGSSATLEVFEYADAIDRPAARPHERGWGHVAFAVEDVAASLAEVLSHGGERLGEIVSREIPGAGTVTFVYARDPEGNVIELQRWERHEVSVEEGYARWADTYDEVDNPTRDADAAVVRRWIDEPLANLDVLELGCGTGKNTRALAAARSVVAFDLSEPMLARAAQAAPFARFVRHDLSEVPWPLQPGAFDRGLMNLVLEHVRDVAPVVAQLARVLRPGGRALLVELHPYRQLDGRQARFVDPRSGETLKVAAHPHSVSELIAAARGAGFVVEAVGEHGDDGAAVPAGSLPRLLSLELVRPG